ncbi:MAG: hypothetical protein GAK29_03708 [Acinetobacter bereziniae]|uniref:Uncharacterized protein n=1 Tax=Acinetobacter bereziniae TaxID=106648 RepID=A0A833TVB9_ACIBZ|nr:MAG: hypothetical protein GAK29_03708 [Acinetobacter bereziniae]
MTDYSDDNNKVIFSSLDKEYFLKLNSDHKIIWMSRLGYYLSIEIRGIIFEGLDSSGNIDSEKINLLNDILLQIFGKIDSKTRSNDNFPDADFFNLLKEKAEKAHFSPRLFTLFVKDIEYRVSESN